MQVSNPNNVKIYNLSAGKSLPEWLTDRKKRSLQKSDVELRQRIQLMQDFDMPGTSTSVKVSTDRQFILATGTYKPRVKCFDVAQMSLKFERCVDADIVRFLLLSDDYSKMVFLQNDRYVEFHSQQGRWYRMRLPKYGLDMAYHDSCAELYFVGVSDEIYRFNLEQGRYMIPLKSNASEISCCKFNPEHELFACGTKEGLVECWDPRTRNRVGVVNSGQSVMTDEGSDLKGRPSVTALKFRDGLHMAVGTSSGHVLLYDIRAAKPELIKDHNYGLPILDIEYHSEENLMLSCDEKILKIWDQHSGAPCTSIEPESRINGLCVVPKSGMLFLANEAPKILAYYIPMLGPAPRWCAFLDSLTEELEENPTPSVYDDYKFVTRGELQDLGLGELIGTDKVRACLHGYFIDIRLYRDAKARVQPFIAEEYRKKKIEEKNKVENRVKLDKLPRVNKSLAEKLMIEDAQSVTVKKSKKRATRSISLLRDPRFAELFTDADYEVDEASEEYRLLNPLVSKRERERRLRDMRTSQPTETEGGKEGGDEEGEREAPSSEEEDSSSDDEHTWQQEVKEQRRLLAQEKYMKEKLERQMAAQARERVKFSEIKAGDRSTGTAADKERRLNAKKSLGDRAKDEEDGGIVESGVAFGNLEMTYQLKKSFAAVKREEENKAHVKERKKLIRSANLLQPRKPGAWRGRPKR